MVNVSRRKISKKLGKQLSKNPIGNPNFIDPKSEWHPRSHGGSGWACCLPCERQTHTNSLEVHDQLKIVQNPHFIPHGLALSTTMLEVKVRTLRREVHSGCKFHLTPSYAKMQRKQQVYICGEWVGIARREMAEGVLGCQQWHGHNAGEANPVFLQIPCFPGQQFSLPCLTKESSRRKT